MNRILLNQLLTYHMNCKWHFLLFRNFYKNCMIMHTTFSFIHVFKMNLCFLKKIFIYLLIFFKFFYSNLPGRINTPGGKLLLIELKVDLSRICKKSTKHQVVMGSGTRKPDFFGPRTRPEPDLCYPTTSVVSDET